MEPRRPRHGLREGVEGHRLQQVAKGALLQGLHRGLDLRVAGHEQDREIEIPRAHRLQELQARSSPACRCRSAPRRTAGRPASPGPRRRCARRRPASRPRSGWWRTARARGTSSSTTSSRPFSLGATGAASSTFMRWAPVETRRSLPRGRLGAATNAPQGPSPGSVAEPAPVRLLNCAHSCQGHRHSHSPQPGPMNPTPASDVEAGADSGRSRGKSMVKTHPRPGRLRTRISPPWWRRSRLAMVSPRPSRAIGRRVARTDGTGPLPRPARGRRTRPRPRSGPAPGRGGVRSDTTCPLRPAEFEGVLEEVGRARRR